MGSNWRAGWCKNRGPMTAEWQIKRRWQPLNNHNVVDTLLHFRAPMNFKRKLTWLVSQKKKNVRDKCAGWLRNRWKRFQKVEFGANIPTLFIWFVVAPKFSHSFAQIQIDERLNDWFKFNGRHCVNIETWRRNRLQLRLLKSKCRISVPFVKVN